MTGQNKKRSCNKRTRDLWNTRREIQTQTKLDQPSWKIGKQQTHKARPSTVLLPHSYVAKWPRRNEVTAQIIRPVPEAVVTVLCTPDDGCVRHPKHVEWSCSKIKQNACLMCVCLSVHRWICVEKKQPTRCHCMHCRTYDTFKL